MQPGGGLPESVARRLDNVELDHDCPFCRIILGETQADIVAEDEHALAFLDITPSARGHTLVVPKAHVERFPELPAALLEPLFSMAQRVGDAAKEAVGAPGFMTVVNTTVGQTVPHVHVHVLPRWEGDALDGCMEPHAGGETSAEDRRHLAERIRATEAVGTVPT